jgi:hypothetical protein
MRRAPPQLAIATTRALGVGFMPRRDALDDPRDGSVIPGGIARVALAVRRSR